MAILAQVRVLWSSSKTLLFFEAVSLIAAGGDPSSNSFAKLRFVTSLLPFLYKNPYRSPDKVECPWTYSKTPWKSQLHHARLHRWHGQIYAILIWTISYLSFFLHEALAWWLWPYPNISVGRHSSTCVPTCDESYLKIIFQRRSHCNIGNHPYWQRWSPLVTWFKIKFACSLTNSHYSNGWGCLRSKLSSFS